MTNYNSIEELKDKIEWEGGLLAYLHDTDFCRITIQGNHLPAEIIESSNKVKLELIRIANVLEIEV